MHRLVNAAKSLAAATALALVAAPALADTDYTDHWQNPQQTGWGVALTQGTNAIFTEIFHYNASGQPAWFGGTMYRIADGHFAGTLYTVSGDYFGHMPYNPALFTVTQAGSMDFKASDPSHAIFTFTNNGVTVTTPVERITLDAISVAGTYFGAFVQTTSSACNSDNQSHVDYQSAQILVGQSALPGGTVTMQFKDVVQPFSIFYTMQGAATQFGKVLDIPSAAYASSQSSFTPLHVYDLRRTANGGIEGRWKTISGTSDKCVDEGRFSGVLQ